MIPDNENIVVTELPDNTDTIAPGEPIVGAVVDCARLNVRKTPFTDAAVECTIPSGTEVIVCEDESTDEFYKVCTAAGIEGYCMKKYIDIAN